MLTRSTSTTHPTLRTDTLIRRAKKICQFPILLATQEVAGIYNIVYRYLFDRHRDLSLPTSFLIDCCGQNRQGVPGNVRAQRLLLQDLASAPSTPTDRARNALPFPGTLYQDAFQRNAFTYGVAFFQHGFLDQAAQSFKQVIAAKPEDPEAYYNLGTALSPHNSLPEAQQYLEQTVKLRPNYPEAWNNLGMIAAQAGNTEEAIRDFQQSLELRPAYATALLNLGNLYRRQGNLAEAEKLLKRALDGEPDNPEVNYSLGMFYAPRDKQSALFYICRKPSAFARTTPTRSTTLGVLFVQTTTLPGSRREIQNLHPGSPEL